MTSAELTTLLPSVVRLAIRAGEAILGVYESGDFQTEQKPDDSPLTLGDRLSHRIIDDGLVRLSPAIPVLSEEGRSIPYAERKHWRELWLVDPLDGTKEFIKRNGEFTVNIAYVRDGEPVMGVIYAPVARTVWAGLADGDSRLALRIPPSGVSSLQSDAKLPAPASGAPLELLLAAGIHAEPITVGTRTSRRVAIIASRTHLNDSTRAFIDDLAARFSEVEIISVGSSLKLCYLAEGRADLYPRYAPTSEWDTAAGHAIVRAAGGEVYAVPRSNDSLAVGQKAVPLRYNKEDLLNPYFVARAW